MNAIGSVAVVGAGTMGLGITLVCASQGFDTVLYDLLPAQTEKALRAKQFPKGEISWAVLMDWVGEWADSGGWACSCLSWSPLLLLSWQSGAKIPDPHSAQTTRVLR